MPEPTVIIQDDVVSVIVQDEDDTVEIYEGVAPNAGGDHNHDDRYYTEAETDVLLTAVEDKNYYQVFTNQSSVTATHNLGKYPSVTVFNSAGDEVVGAVNYLSINVLTVTFSSSFTGIVTLN